jgi:opacity protein-like surface antigen
MRLCTLLATVSIAALTATAASAKGYKTYGLKGSVKDYAYTSPVKLRPTWYVRLDGAAAVHDRPEISERGTTTLTSTDYKTAMSFGGGIGYFFTPSIRADLTYEHRFETDIVGQNASSAADIRGTRQFGLSSDLFLANFYYDIDPGAMVNPYVGVAIGFARHSTTDGTIENCGCVTGTIEGGETWNAVGGLMTGATISLMKGFELDAGYRFLYLGEAKTASSEASTRHPNGMEHHEMEGQRVEAMRAHEFRFGLRYAFK